MNYLDIISNFLLKKNPIFNTLLQIIFIATSLVFLQKFFKTQFSRKNKLIYLVANTSCIIFTNFILGYIYSYIFIFAISIILVIYLFKLPKLYSLLYFSLKSIIVLNAQLFVFKTIYAISSFENYLQILELPVFNLSSIILMSIIGYIIYFCLNRFKFSNLLISSLTEKSNLITALSILNLTIVLLIFYNFFDSISKNWLYILALDLYFYFSITNVLQLCQISYAKQKIENLKLCNKTILTMYDDTRAFKHDFHNIIQAIGGYILTNDIDGLKKYYTQVSGDCKDTNTLSKLSPTLINNPAIYNLLVDKYYRANNNNIEFNIEVMLDLNNLNIKIYELTRILGILLDNAIEASKECTKKHINISFKQDKYKQMFIIENTYNDKEISLEKIFEKDFTTKPNNTGLGLWEVRKILSKNSNLNLHTTKNDDYFSQQLEIYIA